MNIHIHRAKSEGTTHTDATECSERLQAEHPDLYYALRSVDIECHLYLPAYRNGYAYFTDKITGLQYRVYLNENDSQPLMELYELAMRDRTHPETQACLLDWPLQQQIRDTTIHERESEYTPQEVSAFIGMDHNHLRTSARQLLSHRSVKRLDESNFTIFAIEHHKLTLYERQIGYIYEIEITDPKKFDQLMQNGLLKRVALRAALKKASGAAVAPGPDRVKVPPARNRGSAPR